MIQIAGRTTDAAAIASEQQWSAAQREAIRKMADSGEVFAYPDTTALQFELTLRHYIVEAAKALQASGVSFASYERSRCNEQYWQRTAAGGFRIRPDVTPAEAIRDIFRNGRLYAFECATAVVIVYYRAVLAALTLADFNRLFAGILLYDWEYDRDLGLTSRTGTVMLPGDVVYFKNPDVNPNTPEWQGENAVVLGGGRLYGHGIGITSGEQIIRVLNRMRKPGASQSAYLTDSVVRPNFAYLQRFSRGRLPLDAVAERLAGADRLTAWIGGRYYEA